MGNYLYLDDPRTEQMRQAIEFNERNKNTAKLWVRLQQWTKDWNDRSKVEISYNEPNKPKQYVKKMAINNAELFIPDANYFDNENYGHNKGLLYIGKKRYDSAFWTAYPNLSNYN